MMKFLEPRGNGLVVEERTNERTACFGLQDYGRNICTGALWYWSLERAASLGRAHERLSN